MTTKQGKKYAILERIKQGNRLHDRTKMLKQMSKRRKEIHTRNGTIL